MAGWSGVDDAVDAVDGARGRVNGRIGRMKRRRTRIQRREGAFTTSPSILLHRFCRVNHDQSHSGIDIFTVDLDLDTESANCQEVLHRSGLGLAQSPQPDLQAALQGLRSAGSYRLGHRAMPSVESGTSLHRRETVRQTDLPFLLCGILLLRRIVMVFCGLSLVTEAPLVPAINDAAASANYDWLNLDSEPARPLCLIGTSVPGIPPQRVMPTRIPVFERFSIGPIKFSFGIATQCCIYRLEHDKRTKNDPTVESDDPDVNLDAFIAALINARKIDPRGESRRRCR
ncbi:hypothetical protein FPQ18DRAFT_425815 [Pyronema domesticum]|nr:hypothetical protein FPQ18DRAFT_425815 [Pyronema domesticum]